MNSNEKYQLKPTTDPCDACGEAIEDGETCFLRGIWEGGVQTLNIRVHERCWHEAYGRPTNQFDEDDKT